jgi:1,2-diacylglycerol 3-alpha-glucosyltransferase
MRIGMMADIYKPHISGVTNYISLNKEYLENLGHEVYVFTFKAKEEKYEDVEENVIRSVGIPVLDFGFSLNLRYSKETRNLLQTMDIAHVQHPFISGPL